MYMNCIFFYYYLLLTLVSLWHNKWMIITLGCKKYLTLFLERVETSFSVWERHRETEGEDGERGQRLTEDCYMKPYLLSYVVPYVGPHLALLFRGPVPLGPRPSGRGSKPCIWLSARLTDIARGYLCIYNLSMYMVSGCQPTWLASGCQSTWATYTSESLLFR